MHAVMHAVAIPAHCLFIDPELARKSKLKLQAKEKTLQRMVLEMPGHMSAMADPGIGGSWMISPFSLSLFPLYPFLSSFLWQQSAPPPKSS